MPPKRTSSKGGRVTKPATRNKMKKDSFPALRKPAGKATSTSTSTTSPATANMPATTPPPAPISPQPEQGPVYFWRPHQANGYLGQWYSSPFTVDGDTYATAEMWMMVQKARLFSDEAVAQKMLATTDPKRHRALGREAKNFSQKTWDDHKRGIVEQGTYYKFTRSEEAEKLRGLLLETGERELVEASPMDRIWGVGFGEKNAGANRGRWGLNLLGKALMGIRGRLREEEEGKGKGKEE
ncbi:DUF1768-domain-containing protein [Trematosphaeria pertusa]|uniref:DUF1768-domain-containing protein n=1 Tax=Trematosphaeria pertusa TaxID=390896 RepID=A0A6A6I2D7_9PLEO|nr:DUF1768-domain-containing protein [Trematosphaeria pertusa]KAF2244501.1 DUF1768-domain-containing protein [Trematosphaeria pertusa]